MIEKVYSISTGDDQTVERVVMDENVNYIHMVFKKDGGLPGHMSNSTLYMTVVRGRLSIGLDDQEIHDYPAGTLLKIPVDIKMNVRNTHDEVLELIVVKAPAPGK
ncbi:MAG: cupin domain-containing protein [Clostridia bacterium]|nr:cupin domain-containing protein [Clostridia bacterium]